MKKFVISLDRTPERYAEFTRRNSHLVGVEKFKAHDGRVEDKRFYPSKFSPSLDYSPGAVGCALSHIELWHKVAGGNEPVMIFEDDAVVHRDFEGMSSRLIARQGSEWDLVVWGWNFDCPISFELLPGVSPVLAYFLQDGLAEKLDAFQALSLDPGVFTLKFCFGTPAYSLSPGGAEKLLKFLLPLQNFEMQTSTFTARNRGIDVALCSAYPQTASLVCFPPLVVTPNIPALSTTRSQVLEGQPEPTV